MHPKHLLLAPRKLTAGTVLPALLTLLVSLTFFDVDAHSSEDLLSRIYEAAKNVEKVVDTNAQRIKPSHNRTLPEFMLEHYKVVADCKTGAMRRPNLYNAAGLLCFSELNPSSSELFLFDVTGYEKNETVREAELHLYINTPSNPKSPNYTISVYQVLENRSIASPHLHKLLTSQEVDAHASGWQVFNVKEVMPAWISGEPNYSFLVIAEDAHGERVHVEFRRGDESDAKRAIVVLFYGDGSKVNIFGGTGEQVETVSADNEQENETEPRDSTGSRRRRAIDDIRTSMDIYNHIKARENLEELKKERAPMNRVKRTLPMIVDWTNIDKSKNHEQLPTCAKRSLYITFSKFPSLSFVSYPSRLEINHCKGTCTHPLTPDVTPTGHAMLQSLVHNMPNEKNVLMPCCVPATFRSVSLIAYDSNGNAEHKIYHDIVAESCGCR